ncbi:MAG: TIGR01620 family protein [Pseudomonadota bacterium]
MANPQDRSARGPVVLDLDETPLPDAPEPADAAPLPEPGQPAAERALTLATVGRRRGWLGRLVLPALGGIALLLVGLWVADFYEALAARHAWLRWLGLALLGLLAFAAFALAVREIAAIARLGRIEEIHRLAATAAATPGPEPARRVIKGLNTLYSVRPDMAPALAEVATRMPEIPDGPALLDYTERTCMAPLDPIADKIVSRTAQKVAGFTAFVPMPALDVALVLYQNASMIRQIAELYGGRAGWLGSWRLLRTVAQHLVATGAIAATDDLLGPLVGGGVLGSLSRRFGEATVNAALTARVGVAAIEVCRPLPFRARSAPKASTLVLGALPGLGRSKPTAGPGSD